MKKNCLTISELNLFIKDVINAGFPQPVWVSGEIQQYDRNKGKRHVFFELVEKDPKTKDIIARIGLVVFASRKGFIDEVLRKSENAFELKDDIEVKFACKVDFYAPHGAVRLVVENIDPTYTLGKIAQERQKLIAALKKEGVLEKNKQLFLDPIPLQIGLITSDDSAAYNDFISELKKSGYGFKILLRNTIMQGKNCEKDIIKALDDLKRIRNLDAVIITRGGGSIADLSCFDSRLIAEKIASYEMPILTGIGHEINISITDLSAHTFAKTPTAIAQFLSDRIQRSLTDIHDNLDRIIEKAEKFIEDSSHSLKDIAYSLQDGTVSFLKKHNDNLVKVQEIIRLKPKFLISNKMLGLKDIEASLRNVVDDRMKNESRKLNHINRIIEVVHPKRMMQRGFSITRKKTGELIMSVKGVVTEDVVVTETSDGQFESQVSETTKGDAS